MATRRTGLGRAIMSVPAALVAGATGTVARFIPTSPALNNPSLTTEQSAVQRLFNEIQESGWLVQWTDLGQYGGRGIALLKDGSYAAVAERLTSTPLTLQSNSEADLRLLAAVWQQVQQGAVLAHEIAQPLVYRWLG